MTGIYQCRDIMFPGRLILRTRGHRKFERYEDTSRQDVPSPHWTGGSGQRLQTACSQTVGLGQNSGKLGQIYGSGHYFGA